MLSALLQAAGPACLCRTDGRGLGRTPLHSAIIHGQEGTAELLIEQLLASGPQLAAPEDGQQAVPSSADAAGEDGGDKAPAGARAGGSPAPTSTAVAAGLDAADQQGCTALHWAALKGSTALVRRLLAAGANKEAAAADQVTPLHLAAKGGHVLTVHALLAAGACVTGMCSSPDFAVSIEGPASCVAGGNCAMQTAMCRGADSTCCCSLRSSQPPALLSALPTAASDAHGWMPLHYVALRGDLALFVLLFSPSAPSLAAADAAGAALLTAAIRGGSSEMIGILLLTGATSPQVWSCALCWQGVQEMSRVLHVAILVLGPWQLAGRHAALVLPDPG